MATVRLTASQMTMVPEIIAGEVLLMMLTVMARVGVSEACPPTTTTAETPVNSSEATSDATTVNTSGFPDGSSLNVPPVAAIAGGAGAAVVILIISVVVVIICKRKGSGNRKPSEPFVEFKNQEIPQANDPSEDDVENVQDTDMAMNGFYAVVDKNKKTNNKTKESTGTNGRTGLVQPSSNNAIGRESHMYVNDSILVKASNSEEPDSAGEATDAEAMYSIVEKPWKAKPMAAVKPVQTAKASTLPSNLSTSNPSRQHQHTEDEYNAISFTERRSVPGAVHHDYSHIGHASPMNLSVPDLQSQQTDGQYNTLGYTEQRSAPEGLQADYSHIGHASPMNLSVPDLQSQPTDGQYNTLGFTEQRSAPDGLQADYSHVGQAFPVSRSTSDLQQPDTDDQYNTPSG
ncbi:hypothetical protein BaRGS_00038503 [Batillaria attramentaria]|uniref:Uncharacterized protein n=1 Tax=Batillaria attramentaria TaxID=370345 RepID=A0ABD0J694_9CAEN